MFGRDKVAMVVAEFLGTFSLACAMLAMLGRSSFPFFPAAVAGMVFGLMTLILASSSGAHLNPALTIGLWANRKIETTRAIVYIVSQMLGGLVAWKLIEYLLESPLKSIAGDKFLTRVLVAEAVGAFIFAFGIAAALYQGFKGLRYAVTVGSSLALGILVASFAGNGLINPAVALAIRSWNTAYVAGPIIGTVLGVSLYAWLFTPRAINARAAAKAKTNRPSIRVTKKAKSGKSSKKR